MRHSDRRLQRFPGRRRDRILHRGKSRSQTLIAPAANTAMASRRVERVRSLLQREIGEAIRRELPVSQAGLITVNDVEIGGDLRNARVFVSILGTPEQQKGGLA